MMRNLWLNFCLNKFFPAKILILNSSVVPRFFSNAPFFPNFIFRLLNCPKIHFPLEFIFFVRNRGNVHFRKFQSSEKTSTLGFMASSEEKINSSLNKNKKNYKFFFLNFLFKIFFIFEEKNLLDKKILFLFFKDSSRILVFFKGVLNSWAKHFFQLPKIKKKFNCPNFGQSLLEFCP